MTAYILRRCALMVPLQYLYWLRDALQADLGTSIWTGNAVLSLIARALPETIELTLLAMIIPNIVPPLIVIATAFFGSAVVSEAALSFVGLGIPPPNPSWGNMMSGQARTYITVAPWMALFPGIALSLLVFGINLFGDALRDVLDPQLRNR